MNYSALFGVMLTAMIVAVPMGLYLTWHLARPRVHAALTEAREEMLKHMHIAAPPQNPVVEFYRSPTESGARACLLEQEAELKREIDRHLIMTSVRKTMIERGELPLLSRQLPPLGPAFVGDLPPPPPLQ